MWVSHCIEEVCEGSTNPEKSFVVGWPTCNFVATFRYAAVEKRAHGDQTERALFPVASWRTSADSVCQM